MDIPAYARSAHAATNKTVHHPIDFQVPIACAGVSVYPGDVLVGDDEGAVVIPRHLAEKVAELAADMEHREHFLLERIRGGAALPGTYPPDERLQAEYEEHCRSNPKPSEREQ
jgi:regulator of RNase E activity RraA